MPRPKIIHHGFRPGPFAGFEIDSLEIAQWMPDPDGRGQPTQVHLTIRVKGLEDMPFVMRFKGPGTITALIEQLTQHRDEVWPAAKEPK